MAKQKRTNRTSKSKTKFLALSPRQKLIFGSVIVVIALALLLSFLSYVWTWKDDQSTLNVLFDRDVPSKNLLGKLGAILGHFFIYNGIGLASLSLPFLLFLSGLNFFIDFKKLNLLNKWFWGIYVMIVLSLGLGFFAESNPILGGVLGYELNDLITDYIGGVGTFLIILLLVIIYLVVRLGITPEHFKKWFKFNSIKKELNDLKPTKPNRLQQEKTVEEEVVHTPIKEEKSNNEISGGFHRH